MGVLSVLGKRIRLKATAAAAGLLFCVSPAWSANMWCSGTLSFLAVSNGGEVWILPTWRGDVTQVCNVQDEWHGIDTMTCWAWYGLLSKALTDNETLRLM